MSRTAVAADAFEDLFEFIDRMTFMDLLVLAKMMEERFELEILPHHQGPHHPGHKYWPSIMGEP